MKTSWSIWSWTLELCPFAFRVNCYVLFRPYLPHKPVTAQSDLNRTKPTHLSNRNRTQDHKPPLSTPPLSFFTLPLSVHLSRLASPLDRSPQSTRTLSLRHIAFLSLLSTRALMRHTPSCSSLHSTVSPCTLPVPQSRPLHPPLPPYADSNELSINMLALSAIRSLPHAPSTFVSRAIACRR